MSATFHLERRKLSYVEVLVKTTEALKRLRTDKDGVVSFEYVIVAACIVARSGCCVRYWCCWPIATALTTGFTKIATAITDAAESSDSRGGIGMSQCHPFLRHAFDELDCSHSLVSGNTIVGYMLQ